MRAADPEQCFKYTRLLVYYAVNNQHLFYRLNFLHLIGRALLNPQQLPQKIKIGYIQRHSCGCPTATVADTELYKRQYAMRIFYLLAVASTATAAAAEEFINPALLYV
jgi:hypothetical protein